MSFFSEVKKYDFGHCGIEEDNKFGYLLKEEEVKAWAINKVKYYREELQTEYDSQSQRIYPPSSRNDIIERHIGNRSMVASYNVMIEFLMKEFEVKEKDLEYVEVLES